tara:strand:- start:71 stop:547 length:477 start_codon:yes stop_codon:yes gene_type:complete
MGWFKRVTGSIKKFGHKAVSGVQKFGHKAAHVISKAADIAEKALPVVEKVAGGVAKGLTIAEPLVGAVAPEFLPAVEVAKRGASAVSAAARAGTAGVKAGRGIVRGAKQIGAGDIEGGTANIIQSGLAGRTAVGEGKKQIGVAYGAGRELNQLRRGRR